MADRPKVEFPPNVTVQVTIKFDSAQKSDTNQYGVWYLHTVTWNDEDASLFTDQDLQDLLEASVLERGSQLSILKDQPAGSKKYTWKVWRYNNNEWIAIDPRDAPSRKVDPAAGPPPPGPAAGSPAKPPAKPPALKAGTRPDLLGPVMIECLNQAAIAYGFGSWAILSNPGWDATVDDRNVRVELVQKLAVSLFIAATNDRTVLPAALPMADYEAPAAPEGAPPQEPPHMDSTGDDDLPF